MAETGHAKNVANLATMISFVAGYGATYNPSNPVIELAALQTKLAAAQNVLDDVTTGKAGWTVKVNERESAYAGVRKLATRAVNAFAVSADIEDNAIEDAKGIKRKIDGARAKALPNDNPETIENEASGNSVSQRSYTQTAEFFEALIGFFKNYPTYAPNEVELQIVQLESKLASMQTANAAVTTSATSLSNDRLDRNSVLYDDKAGIVEIAGLVKKYVKSVYGADSPQYGQISGLAIRDGR